MYQKWISKYNVAINLHLPQCVLGVSMAGTKNTAHVVQLKPVEVPKCMQDGEKFIKWDEVMLRFPKRFCDGCWSVIPVLCWLLFTVWGVLDTHDMSRIGRCSFGDWLSLYWQICNSFLFYFNLSGEDWYRYLP